MNIYVYSDESGVFSSNNDYFTFGGIIFLNKEDKDISKNLYIKTEKEIKYKFKLDKNEELKGKDLSEKERRKLLRSVKNGYPFRFIINVKDIYSRIMSNKKTRQRYLDYVFKMGLKKSFSNLIKEKHLINTNENINLYIFCDEHTTATDGVYELKESIYQEFKYGILNFEINFMSNPIFPNLSILQVNFSDSKNIPLIRYSDILANSTYKYLFKNNKLNKNKIFTFTFPKNN